MWFRDFFSHHCIKSMFWVWGIVKWLPEMLCFNFYLNSVCSIWEKWHSSVQSNDFKERHTGNILWMGVYWLLVFEFALNLPKLKIQIVIQLSIRKFYLWIECYIFLVLTKHKGLTGKYWPGVMAVWTKCSKVHTKLTEGHYFPVQLE